MQRGAPGMTMVPPSAGESRSVRLVRVLTKGKRYSPPETWLLALWRSGGYM